MPERINPASSLDVLSNSAYRVALFDKKPKSWTSIKDTIFRLHRGSFTEIEDLEEKLQKRFMDPDSITVLLYEADKVVGYTTAAPIPHFDRIQKRHIKTAYGDTMVIDEQHRGKGNLGLLAKILAEELRRQGYEQMETSIVKENGFADREVDYYIRTGRLIRELHSVRNDRRAILIRI